MWSFSPTQRGGAIVLPDGRCDIILRNHETTPDQIWPVITGPATQPYRVTFDVGDQWLGIRLRPEYGAALWQSDVAKAANTALRGQEALDHFPGLTALFGRAPTLEALAQIIPIYTWPTVDPRLTRAVDALHVSGGRLRIAAMAARLACTTRQMYRLFRRHIGLTAKTYAQLVQFHRALKLITKGRVPIAAAAFEAGYADHAHMVRSFRRFGGFTPSSIPTDLSLPDIHSLRSDLFKTTPSTQDKVI